MPTMTQRVPIKSKSGCLTSYSCPALVTMRNGSNGCRLRRSRKSCAVITVILHQYCFAFYCKSLRVFNHFQASSGIHVSRPYNPLHHPKKGFTRMAQRPFVHLHCHTHYSLLDGASRVPELVELVKAQGMNACAMTD